MELFICLIHISLQHADNNTGYYKAICLILAQGIKEIASNYFFLFA